MEIEEINRSGDCLLKKTYDENCQVKADWQRVHSLKLKSLYLPYFVDTYEIVATNNDILFDDCLNSINLYFNQDIMVYMAIRGKQIIYHNSHYMIINRNPLFDSKEWKRLQ